SIIEKPLLKLTTPLSSYNILFESFEACQKFSSILSQTIMAHRHHLLSQSKQLTDIKKFKRHSAFTLDASSFFLKTWGLLPGPFSSFAPSSSTAVANTNPSTNTNPTIASSPGNVTPAHHPS